MGHDDKALRMSLFAQQVAIYNILQAALLATGRVGLALAVAEHCKGEQQNHVWSIERRGARLHSISERKQSLTRIILMRLEGCGTTRPPHVSRRTGLRHISLRLN